MSATAVILVHGGAGNIPDSRVVLKQNGMKKAVLDGARALLNTSKATGAVTAAVAAMEDNESFNAGFGSVLNEDGDVECDAAVMDGLNLQVGGVAGVGQVKNPVVLAEKVLESSPHCLLVSSGAERFAVSQGIQLVPNASLISHTAKRAWKAPSSTADGTTDENIATNELGRDTVGAVALDFKANLAAATSTGGLMRKAKGRVGDSPLIGAGLFADNHLGAVSTTGHGESLYRGLVALRIAERLAGPQEGSAIIRQCLDEMKDRIGGDGGAIAIDAKGQISFEWNSHRMGWAYAFVPQGIKPGDALTVHFGCNKKEHFAEQLTL